MNPTDAATFWTSLGTAAPLVAILLYLLRQSTLERQSITNGFLETLKTTIASNVQAQAMTVDALKEQSSALKEFSARSAEEHTRLIDAIGKAGMMRRSVETTGD